MRIEHKVKNEQQLKLKLACQGEKPIVTDYGRQDICPYVHEIQPKTAEYGRAVDSVAKYCAWEMHHSTLGDKMRLLHQCVVQIPDGHELAKRLLLGV